MGFSQILLEASIISSSWQNPQSMVKMRRVYCTKSHQWSPPTKRHDHFFDTNKLFAENESYDFLFIWNWFISTSIVKYSMGSLWLFLHLESDEILFGDLEPFICYIEEGWYTNCCLTWGRPLYMKITGQHGLFLTSPIYIVYNICHMNYHSLFLHCLDIPLDGHGINENACQKTSSHTRKHTSNSP